MTMDPDDIFALEEEVPDVPRIDATPVQEHAPLIDATPVQEDERGMDFESDNFIVLPTIESLKRERSKKRPYREPRWLDRAFFPLSFCMIGISAFLILYLILK